MVRLVSGHYCMATYIYSNFTIMAFKQPLIYHSAFLSFEPRDILLITELLLFVDAVTLHQTVVFHWIK